MARLKDTAGVLQTFACLCQVPRRMHIVARPARRDGGGVQGGHRLQTVARGGDVRSDAVDEFPSFQRRARAPRFAPAAGGIVLLVGRRKQTGRQLEEPPEPAKQQKSRQRGAKQRFSASASASRSRICVMVPLGHNPRWATWLVYHCPPSHATRLITPAPCLPLLP